METQFNSKDQNKIRKAIHKKYKKVAKSPDGLFKYPTGKPGLEGLQYESEIIKKLPEKIVASYCGVGNPFSLGPIVEGEAVLDVGCGTGVDTIIAAMITGPAGKAVGIDVISKMLEKAKNNISMTELKNIAFQQASAEKLPFPDQHFDVVISNGAFNLVPIKVKALAEVYRVLKPAGRLMVADNVLIGELPDDKKQLIKSWSQ
jgi:SAM-dependent methyltransferase